MAEHDLLDMPFQYTSVFFWGRSGAFLASSLFDAHPDVLSTPPHAICNFVPTFDVLLERKPNFTAQDLLQTILGSFPCLFQDTSAVPELYLGTNKDAAFGVDRKAFARHFLELLRFAFQESLAASVTGRLTETNESLHEFVLKAIHIAYARAKNRPFSPNNPTIVWQAHTPMEWDYLFSRFPQMKAIVCVRNPLSTYDSHLAHHLHETLTYPAEHCFELQFRLLAMLANFCRVPSIYRDRVRAVRFEDVHNRTEATMRSLCHWLALEWSDTMMQSTVDGEPFWFKSGERVLTGTANVDEKHPKLKLLGFVDKVRMYSVLRPAFRTWRYDVGHAALFGSNLVSCVLGLGVYLLSRLAWPVSRCDWICIRKEVEHKLREMPDQSANQKRDLVRDTIQDWRTTKRRFMTNHQKMLAEQRTNTMLPLCHPAVAA